MKKWILLTVILMSIFLAACGNKESDGWDQEVPEMLEVQLEVQDTAEVGDTVSFKATVSQGGEEVTDATEVVYEVWINGSKEESEMIDATNHDDGTYTAEKQFTEEGIYTVQVHVTARGLHNMPKKEVNIGNVSVPEQTEEEDHGEVEESHHH